jgi:ADP-ribose pyrophosphatase YjhB (NUDIX family)
MKKAVCALIMRNGKALCVSRKDDHNDFGMPGGKVDGNESLEDAMEREVLEETGYSVIHTSEMTFTHQCGSHEVTTFLCRISDINAGVDDTETGLVEWLDPTVLLTGSFAAYNNLALKHFGVI